MSVEDLEQMHPEPDDQGRGGSEDSVRAEDVRRRLEELLPAYSIGAVDPDEADFVQAHLADDPYAAKELAEFAALNQALLRSAEGREPSPQLAARLRSAIWEEAAPAVRTTTTGWRERLFGSAAPLWSRVAIAGALALLIVLNVMAASRIRALQEENRLLTAQLSNQQDALALVIANGVQVTTLPAAQEGSGAEATVRWNPDDNMAVLRAEGFPPLAPDMAYQLWLIRDGVRTSGGLFTVDPEGSGTLVVHAPDTLSSFDAMGITPEPAEGSAGPTAPPVVAGSIRTG